MFDIVVQDDTLNTWIKTDDNQWVYRSSLTEFRVINLWEIQYPINEDENEWVHYWYIAISYIDLDDYELDEIKTIMHSYGYDSFEEIDGQIVAECISEQDDDPYIGIKGSLEECEKWIENYIYGKEAN